MERVNNISLMICVTLNHTLTLFIGDRKSFQQCKKAVTTFIKSGFCYLKCFPFKVFASRAVIYVTEPVKYNTKEVASKFHFDF